MTVIERPIDFSSIMVQAILKTRNRKTQTRRVIEPQPSFTNKHALKMSVLAWPNDYRCPFGKPGDRLWVREPFNTPGGVLSPKNPTILYRANQTNERQAKKYAWYPSTDMPRWASRILLEITDVRVERLQEISEADAKAEGAIHWVRTLYPDVERVSAIGEYCALWNSIHVAYGPKGWIANPWVWVILFKRIPGGK